MKFKIYLFLTLIKLEEVYKSIEEYNFYKEIENFQNYIYENIQQYEVELKNEIVNSFKNARKPKKILKNFQKLVPSLDINEKEEYIHQNLKIFINKYNDNFVKLWNSYKSLRMIQVRIINDYQNLYNFIKNNALVLIQKKLIENENDLQKVNDIHFDRFTFNIQLYNFEREILSKTLYIRSFIIINPIHELMPLRIYGKKHRNYISLLLEKIQLFNLPLHLNDMINQLKELNNILIIHLSHIDDINILIHKLCTYINEGHNNESYYFKKLKLVFEKFFLDSLNLNTTYLNDMINNIPDIFKLHVCKIKNIITDFLNKYINFRKSVNSEIFHTYKILENLYENNNVKTKEIIINKFRLILENFTIKTKKIYRELDYGLRKPLDNIFQTIQENKSYDYINTERFIITKSKVSEAYNSILRKEFIAFFSKKLVPLDYSFTTDFIADFRSCEGSWDRNIVTREYIRQKSIYLNLNRKEEIVKQIETLFTDNEIRIKVFFEILQMCENNEKHINQRLEAIVDLKKQKNSKLNSYFEYLVNKHLLEEKQYVEKMKNLIKKLLEKSQLFRNVKSPYMFSHQPLILEKDIDVIIERKSNNLKFITYVVTITIIIFIMVFIFFWSNKRVQSVLKVTIL